MRFCTAPGVLLLTCASAGCSEGIKVDDGTGRCLVSAEAVEWGELTDVALTSNVQDRLRQARGVAAEDFNGDGRVDLFVANWREDPILWLNQGDGVFAEHPSPPTSGFDWGAAVADYDNDDDPDLFIACGGYTDHCANALFRNDGPDPVQGWPTFTDVSIESGIAGLPGKHVGGAWADYDLDGYLDLFVPVSETSSGGSAVPAGDLLFRNNGDGTFSERGADAGVDALANPRQGAWLDYDEDGYADLYVPRYGSENSLYHNNRDGTFTDVADENTTRPIGAWGVLAEDFNHDGHIDLFVSGRTNINDGTEPEPVVDEQPHGLFINDGEGGFIDATWETELNTSGSGAHQVRAMGLQAGDLDLDGWLDIFLGNGAGDHGDRNTLGSFVDNGAGLAWIDHSAAIDFAATDDGLMPQFPTYPYRSHGTVFFDYDDDGDVDLFVGNGGHGADEPNRLFRNDAASSQAWIAVDLRGVMDNRNGVGARVRVSDGPDSQSSWAVYRHVQQSTGFNSSRPHLLQIGLGACDGPFHVTVMWPRGGTQVLSGVTARETVVVEQE